MKCYEKRINAECYFVRLSGMKSLIMLVYLSLTSTTSASLQCLNTHGRILLKARKRPGKTTAPQAKTCNILPFFIFLWSCPETWRAPLRETRPFTRGNEAFYSPAVGVFSPGTVHHPLPHTQTHTAATQQQHHWRAEARKHGTLKGSFQSKSLDPAPKWGRHFRLAGLIGQSRVGALSKNEGTQNSPLQAERDQVEGGRV